MREEAADYGVSSLLTWEDSVLVGEAIDGVTSITYGYATTRVVYAYGPGRRTDAGQLVALPGGGRIGFRPTSTSGPPTIDVMGVETCASQVHSWRRLMAESTNRPDGEAAAPSEPAGMPSEDLAAIIVDALLRAKIVAKHDVERALKIATEEIDVRKSLGDY